MLKKLDTPEHTKRERCKVSKPDGDTKRNDSIPQRILCLNYCKITFASAGNSREKEKKDVQVVLTSMKYFPLRKSERERIFLSFFRFLTDMICLKTCIGLSHIAHIYFIPPNSVGMQFRFYSIRKYSVVASQRSAEIGG